MKRLLVPLAVYIVLTAAMMYPLLLHPASVYPHDLGDPVLNSWLLWWSTKAVPLTTAWWNAPMFYPAGDAMAFSELLLGMLPLTAVVQWITHNPVIAYNIAFLVSFPLSGLAAYLLAIELIERPEQPAEGGHPVGATEAGHYLRRSAAFLCGFAFAFAPYRMGHLAHLQVMAYYWTPIALLGLHRYLRTRETRWLAVFGAAWLMQSLTNGYALFHVSLFLVLWLIWFVRDLRTLARILAAWAVAAIPMLPILLKYRQVHRALHLVRDINEIKANSVGFGDILAASPDLAVWGNRLVPPHGENAIFPGATMLIVGLASFVVWRVWRYGANESRTRDERVLIVLSAIAALVGMSVYVVGPWAIGPLTVSELRKPLSLAILFRVLGFLRGRWMRKAWREQSIVGFYLIGAAAVFVLALGPEPRFLGRPAIYEAPYAWLLQLPGFDTLRVPARFASLMVLCECVLLGVALARWLPRVRRPQVAVAILAMGILGDGFVRVHVEPVPPTGPQWPAEVAAVIELPNIGGTGDLGPVYRSMFHGRPSINGYSGYYPPHYLPLVVAIQERLLPVLAEVARGQLIGIAVNRSGDQARTIEAMLHGMIGVSLFKTDDRWSMYVMQVPEPRVDRVGDKLPIQSVSANRHNQDVGRLLDGRIETAWGSGLTQTGDEEVLIDLGSEQSIGSIELGMGAFSFGFPRQLVIHVSSDQSDWLLGWAGPSAVRAVHAAVTSPGTVPMTFDLGNVKGRYVRLKQEAEGEPSIPWWIAELSVHAP
jgi:F5/8 type C domain-containing protein